MQFFLPDMREEADLRIDRLRRLMRESHVDALLASTTANIFYLSGRVYRGYVYVPLEGEPLWLVVRPDAFDAGSRVVALRKPEMIPDVLGRFGMRMPKRPSTSGIISGLRSATTRLPASNASGRTTSHRGSPSSGT